MGIVEYRIRGILEQAKDGDLTKHVVTLLVLNLAREVDKLRDQVGRPEDQGFVRKSDRLLG